MRDALVAFSHPARDRVHSESPICADPEGRNPALPDQLVNRAAVDSQQFTDFLYGQDVIIECHRVMKHSALENGNAIASAKSTGMKLGHAVVGMALALALAALIIARDLGLFQ